MVYAEEAPVHRVTVDGFWIDRTPVTNRQFRNFVRATGRPDARHRHQARTCLILTGQGFDLAGEALDALIQPRERGGLRHSSMS
jgi:formylglycine-generating enzyme required for sulfatase activity